MPFSLTWEPDGVVRRFYGHVTFDEVRRSIAEIHGDARFDTLHYIIDDSLDMTGYDFADREVAELEAFDAASLFSNGRIWRAFVVNETFGPRMIDEIGNAPVHGYTTRFFSTVADARDWLSRVA